MVLKRIAGVGSGNYIYFWKSKGLSDKRIRSNTAYNYSVTPKLNHYGTKARVKFSGNFLKQHKATYNQGTIVNIYIVYEIIEIIILAVIHHLKSVCLKLLV